ncbi:GNAT family N-acetyltransferase [uncultured Cohaesibacter sp.]|uniref:GNAT family N-acetyltransferase n=1 Tax=uncultured Cohaesibacter sp. TaxID=1002546 RepID=UPI0037478ED2
MGSFLTRSDGERAVHPRLCNDHVYLRYPHKTDFDQWVHLRAASAGFLRPWEPIWPHDDLSLEGFSRRLEQYGRDRRSGRALPYLIFRKSDRELIGGVNVSNIRRGICQTATIGYWMGVDYANQGHMRRALALLLPYLFDCQGLHRVEAACLPINYPSIAVLKRQGFQLEGRARSYLCINGKWEDHLLFAALRADIANLPD